MPTLPNLTVNSFAIPPSSLWYWYYYFQKQKALFQRYNSSRVDLYARTKDLWVSSSCGDSYEIQAYHMTRFMVNYSYNALLRVPANFHSKIEQRSPPGLVLRMQNSSSTATVWHSNKPRFYHLHVPMKFQQPNSGTYLDDSDLSAKCAPLGIKKNSISRKGAFSGYFLYWLK